MRQKSAILPAFLGSALLSACVTASGGSTPVPPTAAIAETPRILRQMASAAPSGTIDPLAGPLYARPADQEDPWPRIGMAPLDVENVNVLDALRLALLGTGIALTSAPDVADKRVTAHDLKGSLETVVQGICRAAGVWCTHRKGVLDVNGRRAWTVELPPVAEAFDDIAKTMSSIAGSNVSLDQANRRVTYFADRRQHDAVENYLADARRSKAMIVYDAWVIEVSAPQAHGAIEWRALIETHANAPTEGSGAVYIVPDLSLDRLRAKVGADARLRTLSNPTLSLISGTKSEFQVGSTTRFVASIGNERNDASKHTRIETAEIPTGMNLTIAGDLSGDSVWTGVQIDVTNVSHFETVKTDTAVFRLPQTSKSKLSARVQSRPGETILITGIAGGDDYAPSDPDASATSLRSEIAVALKPRLVRFANN